MAKEKSRATVRADAASRQSAVDRRHRVAKKVSKPSQRDRHARVPGPMVNLPARLQLEKPAFKSYFEFQENKDKKDKKLETSVTTDKNPPPGFSFVPVGNPELTKRCKELSRESEYLIFIVSDKSEERRSLQNHVHRIGYHFRSSVVEEACNDLGGIDAAMGGRQSFDLTESDKIPETQAEINKQADAALRDLFPRIPNHDREQIIAHAFQKGAIGNSRQGAPVVGLSEELPLARRVQLAANAHIRHVHTRYDELLRKTDWFNARRLVEPVCLDVIMKWRGDEETGRDQLDEILREVVIIPDSDDEEDENQDETAESTSDDEVQFVREVTRAPSRQASPPRTLVQQDHMPLSYRPPAATRGHPDDPEYTEQQKNLHREYKRQSRKQQHLAKRRQKQQRPDKQERRGFARYQAYEEAKKRRNQAGQAASADLPNYDDEGAPQRDPLPMSYYPPPPSMARQPPQEPHSGNSNDNNIQQPQFGHPEVRSPVPQMLNGRHENDRLQDAAQDIFASRPQESVSFQQQPPRPGSIRPMYVPHHERNASSQQFLPILSHEQHKQREQYYQNRQLHQRPPSPEDRNVLASIENIDLTDSPMPVRRASPRQIHAAPRRVVTAPQPQPQFEDEYRQMDEPVHFRPPPGRPDIVYVHDHDGKRRKVYQQPAQHYAEPPAEYVVAPRPRQDSHTFPMSRAQVAASQPSVMWVDEPYNPHQPILVSSSPLTHNLPATAPQPLMLLRGGHQSRQPSGMFEDIFYDEDRENQTQAQSQRGELKRQRPISGYGHQQFVEEPAMRIVRPREPIFGVPSALSRASTLQYPVQENRRPMLPVAYEVETHSRPVEQLPVYDQYGQRIQVGETELQRIVRQADSRGPVYVRGSFRDAHQPESVSMQAARMGQDEFEDAQYEPRQRHDYRALRPTAPMRSQTDIENQPRYRERLVPNPLNPNQNAPTQQPSHTYEPAPLPIRTSASNEHIGPDGQRYITLPGMNGQPGEVLPVRSEHRPMSRPMSRVYREGTRGPEAQDFGRPERIMRTQSGFGPHGGMEGMVRTRSGFAGQEYGLGYQQQGERERERVFNGGEVIVLDD